MFRHIRIILSRAALAVFTSALATGAVGMDSTIGVWKQITTRVLSTGEPGSEPVVLIHADAQKSCLHLISDTVDSEGRIVPAEFTGKFDGKSYPVTGLPDADTVSVHRSDTNAIDCSYKRGRKVVRIERVIVSRDGRTATVFTRGKGSTVTDFTVVSVWGKQ